MPTSSRLKLTIPDGITFADLNLSRHPVTGEIAFDWWPIERICEASGLDVAIFKAGPEDNVATLFAVWYDAHRAEDGDPDPALEAVIAELRSEH